ncbi:hypothetical protein OK414_14670 [Priestia sp. JV24]|uniref:hypothetical protein n=1 Tax=Priestia TaxID=2800373 RepID=UPI0021D658FC|nr:MULTISPECIES: hypothetical protein [Priestia]MCU7712460.1 hypothetical protein [Priestia megaterium]MCW1046289.1 hypothetical protein [Priestia sp. JV24]
MRENEEFLYNVSYLQEKLDDAFSDARASYKVLEKQDSDLRYQLSLTYMNMSFQSYIEAKRIYKEAHLEHHEFEGFFEAYKNYKFELKQVIIEKDQNTSWLYSRYETLSKEKKELDLFIKGVFQNS